MSWTIYDILLRQTEPLCVVETLDDASRKAQEILKTRNTRLRAVFTGLGFTHEPVLLSTAVYFDGTGG